MLHECNVGLDQPCLDFVVAQAGTRIQRADVVERLQHGFQRTSNRFRNFLVLLVLHGPKVLIDDGRGVLQKLFCAVAVLVQCQLLLVVAQLGEQASAQVATAHARRI